MSSLANPIARLEPGTLLRSALKLDAVVTGANGVAYLAGAGVLDSVLGADAAALRGIGAFLIAFAAFVWFVGSRPEIPRGLAREVAIANAAWVVASVVVAIAGSLATAGTVWALMQAAVVGGFAVLQAYGLKRSR